ncbi:MAG: ATP-binding protein [Candidatus Omnitrophota bacterium]
MKEFLKGQYDYIFFFYGLSFFFMALICFTMGREKLRKLPWIFLGLFGLFHGLTEWLEMLIIIQGRSRAVSILKLVSLSISFLCLFEFARRGILRIKEKRVSPWAYAPFIILFFLGLKSGLSGLQVSTRYFLGFPAAYAASRIIYEFSKQDKDSGRALTLLGVIMALYSVLTGFVVPQAEFMFSGLLNAESFYQKFGLPVELVRGILMLTATLLLWSYSSTLSEAEYKPQWFSERIRPSKRVISLILIFLLAAGWAFTNRLDYYAGIQMIKKDRLKKDSHLNRLTRELTLLGRATISMSRPSPIREVISQKNPENEEKAKTILEQFKTKFNALDCFLLDAQGMLIASAADSAAEAEKGKSYASRPYFKEAMLGDNGYSFKLGPVYNERIYYVSYPVEAPSGEIIGVAVIVKSILAEPLFQYRLFSITITFFICLIVIIFFIALRKREALFELIKKAHLQLQEVDRMKSDFICVVSHELRTPLTSIRNAADILIKGGPFKRSVDVHEKELLEIILNNVDRQTRMVSDLLDLSKIEAGVMPIVAKPVEIAALVRDTVGSLQAQAEEKKINMAVAYGFPERKVYCDPEHTRRILTNLVVNAIKFTPEHGRITVKVEDAAKEARITVSDTGIGISGDDKEKIFDKFYRSCDEAVQHKKGWGLGLTITKGLVEAQKGKIWLNSTLGKGSSFYFTLPYAAGE